MPNKPRLSNTRTALVKTTEKRVQKTVLFKDLHPHNNCIHCLRCWIFSLPTTEGKKTCFIGSCNRICSSTRTQSSTPTPLSFSFFLIFFAKHNKHVVLHKESDCAMLDLYKWTLILTLTLRIQTTATNPRKCYAVTLCLRAAAVSRRAFFTWSQTVLYKDRHWHWEVSCRYHFCESDVKQDQQQQQLRSVVSSWFGL